MRVVVDRLEERLGGLGVGVYAALLGLAALTLCGAVGLATRQPWLFPSLGPTAMLLFESGRQRESRPQNIVVGHWVGILVGAVALHGFGLASASPAPVGGLTARYVAAGALSVAVTSLVLQLVRLPHPPAGASTLIVSLGILTTPVELVTMAAAVALLAAAGWAVNRALGLRPASARTPGEAASDGAPASRRR